jgi:hypothetical protein
MNKKRFLLCNGKKNTPTHEGTFGFCQGKNTSGIFTANNFNRLQNISNMFLPNFMKTVNKENFVKFSNISLSIKPFLYGKEKFSTVKTNCLEKMPLETPSLTSSNRRNNSDYTIARSAIRADETIPFGFGFTSRPVRAIREGRESDRSAFFKNEKNQTSKESIGRSLDSSTLKGAFNIFSPQVKNVTNFDSSSVKSPDVFSSEMLARGSNFNNKVIPKKTEYKLETFHRSNQDTCLTHKPAVFEGDWVQSGDFLTDCANSVGGELSLGQNIFIAYMPWEGYNFEDAILISERLVSDDLFTSVHIERYEIENIQKDGISQQERLTNKEINEKMKSKGKQTIARSAIRADDTLKSARKENFKNSQTRQTSQKTKSSTSQIRTTRYEEITRDIPDVTPEEICHLDSFGIVKIGSIVEEGDILVGKITPINKKDFTPYQKLLYTILDKQIRPYRDSSLRAPKGIKAKVIDIKIFVKPGSVVRSPFAYSSGKDTKVSPSRVDPKGRFPEGQISSANLTAKFLKTDPSKHSSGKKPKGALTGALTGPEERVDFLKEIDLSAKLEKSKKVRVKAHSEEKSFDFSSPKKNNMIVRSSPVSAPSRIRLEKPGLTREGSRASKQKRNAYLQLLKKISSGKDTKVSPSRVDPKGRFPEGQISGAKLTATSGLTTLTGRPEGYSLARSDRRAGDSSNLNKLIHIKKGFNQTNKMRHVFLQDMQSQQSLDNLNYLNSLILLYP